MAVANISKANILIKGIVEEAKKRFIVEAEVEVAEFVKRMEEKKIHLLQGVVMEVESRMKVDMMTNEVLFIVKE